MGNFAGIWRAEITVQSIGIPLKGASRKWLLWNSRFYSPDTWTYQDLEGPSPKDWITSPQCIGCTSTRVICNYPSLPKPKKYRTPGVMPRLAHNPIFVPIGCSSSSELVTWYACD